jgi:hypothetical protein
MSSNSLISFLDEDKYNSERLLALKYIRERVERASTVHNILAPITPQDEFIFDVARANDNMSEVSQLSDPFAELGGNIIMSAENKQKRRLSKVEADVLVMNSFPATHMQIQNEIVAEMSLMSSSQVPMLDIAKIMENNQSSDEEDDGSEIFQIASALEQVGLKVYKERKQTESRQNDSRQKQRPKKTKTQEEQDMEANSMLSGVWRMLGEAYFSAEITSARIRMPKY